MEALQCNHKDARCVESTEPKDEGRFVEKYECVCGATGRIEGNEQDLPQQWTRTGEVFQERSQL